MSFAIILIVSIVVFNSGAIDKIKNSKQETITKVAEQKVLSKPILEEVEPTPKQPDPVKKEVKVEIKKPEPIKEEVQVEIKQPEPIKEIVKKEPKIEAKTTIVDEVKKEVKLDDPDSNYLKIILYIIGAIAAVFGGFYFFSNRGNKLTTNNTAETSRRDIEENYQPETQEQQPVQEETPTESQEQQPAQEETPTESQEQQPAQEETPTESQEQGTTEEDENNNKQ